MFGSRASCCSHRAVEEREAGVDSAASTTCVPRSALGRWLGRAGAAAQWGAPIGALALIPKCPACVAGYIVLITGVGVSLPFAMIVRWAVLGLSLIALAWLAVRAIGRRRRLGAGAGGRAAGARSEAPSTPSAFG